MSQSAVDLCATPADFEKGTPTVVISKETSSARRYLSLPFSCQIVSYGSGAVASVSPEFYTIAENYVKSYPEEHLFETPNLHVLNDALMKKDRKSASWQNIFYPI